MGIGWFAFIVFWSMVIAGMIFNAINNDKK
jgi:hypothetical protein